MSTKKIFSVLFFFTAFIIPSVTNAASVEHFFSSGAFGQGYASSFDGCTFSSIDVYASESTVKAPGAGHAAPVPGAYVNIQSFNICTQEAVYWYGSSNSISFSHTPSTHEGFPQTIAMSGDFVVTDLLTGNNANIHVDLQLVNVGSPQEVVYSIHYEYPFDSQTVKVDDDTRGHQSFATGSVSISGDFQYTNAAISGYVGVSTNRRHTVLHS